MDIQIEQKKFKRRHLWLIIGVALIIGLMAFVYKSTSGEPKLKVNLERLTISNVQDGVFQENIPVNGTVLPISTIYLDALEGGRVEEIYVEDGATVKKGDPILRLSNTDLELSLINQETSVYNLLTQMRISQNAARQNTIVKLNQFTDVENALIESKRLFDLNKSLFEEEAVGRQDFESAENNYKYQQRRMTLIKEILVQDSIANIDEVEQAKNSYGRTRKALKLMQRKVNDLVVRAAVDGQLTSLDAEIGQSKNKGERLGQVDVLNGFKVRADIDEHYISRIYPGQQGTYSAAGQQFNLTIKKVYSQVTSGRFQVDMIFENEVPEGIRRGQSLQLRLALSDEKQAIMIPKGGFFQNTGGNWIFKVNEAGDLAYKVDIRLGNQNSQYYEVIQGLQANDKVITSSYDNFKDIQELILK